MAATRRSKPAGRTKRVAKQVTAAAAMAGCAAARRSAAARPLPPPRPSRPATPPLLTRVPAALAVLKVALLHQQLHPLTIAAGGREGRRHTPTTHTRQHAALYRHTTHTCRRAI